MYDRTLHIDATPTAGAVHALKKLQASHIPIRFVTNTTKESTQRLHAKLTLMGFEIDKNHILSSLSATKTYVKEKGYRPLLFLEDAAMEEFEGISRQNPNAVVMGLAPTQFNYHMMNEAFQVLRRGGPLIAMHKARYYASSESELSLGPGPFVTALEYAADVQATLVGKPSARFFQTALESMGLDDAKSRSSVVMIGDDVRDDIGGAMSGGLTGFLVKTGKYSNGDECRHDGIRPTRTFDSFAHAVDFIVSGVID